MLVVLTSVLLVALAEVGDKTMMLAIILAARFRRPAPIVAGIFTATILNHLVAAWAGAEIAGLLDSRAFRLAVALGFIAMAAWTLVPDRFDDSAAATPRHGVFLATLVSFFTAEIGDKTQIATAALAARYHAVWLVAVGTTVGMMLVNVPAVLLGERIVRIVPLRPLRFAAAALLAGVGLVALWQLLG